MVNEVSSLGRTVMSQKGGIDIGKGFAALSSTKKDKSKVDTPLVYENTERREWTFQFNLIADRTENASEMLRSDRKSVV